VNELPVIPETNTLEVLLQVMIDLNASDLHLAHNSKIAYRVDGKIKKQEKRIKGGDIFKILTDAKAISDFQLSTMHITQSADFAYSYKKVRFRGNLTKEKGNYTCVIRRLSDVVIPMDEMGLPNFVKEELKKKDGLILITGATGSGKTTSLTSMIDHMNENFDKHITTIEQPIEYIHTQKESIITQQEVGRDTPSFALGMRAILRRDPDVILIGEMRDLETIEIACVAAETGHLVFGTLHTNTAIGTIERITSIFPAIQQQNIRSQLASNLRIVINQRLIPRINGGRIPAYEILVVTKEMRKAIRDNDIEEVERIMIERTDVGNKTMSQAIDELKAKGLISQDEVY
jgi:twitching motility protein PilT